ncbi:hypothetical protein MODO_2163 [Myroides odoratimimus]|uniref:Uncharacterized protein n=1 Tax=Myroides odoratimimus CCUG 10230 TaxID=883150 RepID=A0ABP2NAN2_9FLAO|nr:MULTISPECIES: hypothetical protein [Myroides]AJA67464.1 hypothetical protein MYRA21_0227 [Myroides sp. A21]EHO09113.1 hypothetical protein HMPREF9712_01894 [Myroides odoratimimus CCUG 10230]MDM1066376.1 hypothetical protein [Myroides odoratimimus]MDM1085772.1 hypothetical protein [Myroides odoratimimus]MDM1457831.1 hypothetical protein [Myroides odoratimimus]
MKKTYIGFAGLSLLLLLGTQTVQAQQGFGTDKPNKSAAVDIQSSKRGLLIPRVNLKSTVDAVTIDSPAQSLMVYNQATTTSGTNDVTPGYYYWDIDRWARFAKQSEITEIELKGDVTGKTGDTKVVAIQGTSISDVAPTANQVLTYDVTEGKWKAVSLTENNLTSSKGITGTGITVGGTDNGAGSVLKEVTLSITHGEANQVMVTNADGNGTTWVDQSTLVPTTTNELISNGNTLTSNVNGVSETANIVNTIENTLDKDNKLVTTVNGKSGEGLDLTPAIEAGQKTTSVKNGSDKVTVVTTGAGTKDKNTEYTVDVVEKELSLQNIGGQVTNTQITDGAVTTEKIKPGKNGEVLVTVNDGEKEVTKWVSQKDIVKANETVTTIKGGTNITATKATDSHEYTLDVPTATKDVAGVVKPGKGLDVATDGTLTVNYDTAKKELATGNVTSSSIVVNDDKGSVGSTFKDVTLEIKAGTNGQVMVTKEGKATWVAQSEIVPTTTNAIKTDGTNIVTTVNNQKAELTLAGDVVLKNGETVVGGIQGTPVSETKPAAGQTLVYNTTTNTWEPGTPNVGVDNVTDGKNLTAADGDAATIEVVNGGLKAVLVETSLRVKEESITSKEIKNGTIKPEDVAKAGKNQVLVTDSSGVPTWKNQNKVAPQFFYMPAVIFDTKSKGTKLSRDLYKEYVDQFTGGKVGVGNAEYPIAHGAGGYTMPYTGGIVGSTDAPADIAVFDKGELHYYVTYYDTKVFANLSIDKDGKLTYDIIGNATPASYMNIVFVIK